MSDRIELYEVRMGRCKTCKHCQLASPQNPERDRLAFARCTHPEVLLKYNPKRVITDAYCYDVNETHCKNALEFYEESPIKPPPENDTEFLTPAEQPKSLRFRILLWIYKKLKEME